MDRPGPLVKKLLLKPSVFRLLGPLIRTGLHSLF
jgi:hypothetical protein